MDRRTRRFLGTAMVLSVFALRSLAQISPGPLSIAHASLEGLDHCTACHTLGKTLSNENCLHCHGEIGSRMREGKGFHANLSSRQCVECHKEHHGRDFPMEKFDPATFHHDQVQYPLIGRHGKIACRDCHTKDLIRAKDIVGKSDFRKHRTYLGLSRDCVGCHQDPHRGQLSSACTNCHGQEHWKPVNAFSHDQTKYPLTGLHATVDCARCHPPVAGNPSNLKFVGIAFSSCTSCHQDPHAGKFGAYCERCHSTSGWLEGATRNFNHAMTRYPLLGKHRQVRCEGCHGPRASVTNLRSGQRTPFKVAHFGRCRDCHSDPHNGQFAKRKDGGACEACHTVDGYSPSLFTIDGHRDTPFPLRGAHRAVPCSQCHPSGVSGGKAKVVFRRTKYGKCSDCHEDVHAGEFAGRMPKSCETCHSVDRWRATNFSHDKTRFPLDGKHRNLPCDKCHQPTRIGTKSVRTFNGLPIACEGCHGAQRKFPLRTGS
ncbi:MAG: hypothetical protein WB699_06330 [Bacteroidota bacterium]